MKEKDTKAIERALRGLPPSLLIPIGAKDENSIIKYIGSIERTLVQGFPNKAFIVNVEPHGEINKKLAIWKHPESTALNQCLQVWVHVDYKQYRQVYKMAFPEVDLSNKVVDHILNRRVARLKGMNYIRLLPISRAANSSSGSVSEQYGYEYFMSKEMQEIYKDIYVQYADLADIVKMLDIKTGGSFQEGVNEAQKYLLEDG